MMIQEVMAGLSEVVEVPPPRSSRQGESCYADVLKSKQVSVKQLHVNLILTLFIVRLRVLTFKSSVELGLQLL